MNNPSNSLGRGILPTTFEITLPNLTSTAQFKLICQINPMKLRTRFGCRFHWKCGLENIAKYI